MKNIAAKLVRVMSECGYVQKQGKNDFHKYNYAKAEDVLEKVNPSLVAHGIAVISRPKLIELRDVTTAKGNVEHLATVETTLTLIDSESGETLETVGLGGGQDAGDKAVMKAQTAAIKYAWMTALQMATGDDPEADAGTDERTTGSVKSQSSTKQAGPNQPQGQPVNTKSASEPQVKKIKETIVELGLVEKAVSMLTERYGVDKTEKLTMTQASEFIAYLLELKKSA